MIISSANIVRRKCVNVRDPFSLVFGPFMMTVAFLGKHEKKKLADLHIWGEEDNPDFDITIGAIVLTMS